MIRKRSPQMVLFTIAGRETGPLSLVNLFESASRSD